MEAAREIYLKLIREEGIPISKIMTAMLDAAASAAADSMPAATLSSTTLMWNVEVRYHHGYDSLWYPFEATLPRQFAIGRLPLCREHGIDVTQHLKGGYCEMSQMSRVQMVVLVMGDCVYFVDMTSFEGTTVVYDRGYNLSISQSVPGARQVMKVKISQFPVKLQMGNEAIEMKLDLKQSR